MQKQVVFKNNEHKEFYKEKIMEYQEANRVPNCYIKSLLYLLSLAEDTRKNFGNLFDMKEGRIKPESMKESWVTGTTKKLCCLAFNLYNGYTKEGRKQLSESYVVDNIFCCEYAPYFVQAVKIRYLEYFRSSSEFEKNIEELKERRKKSENNTKKNN